MAESPLWDVGQGQQRSTFGWRKDLREIAFLVGKTEGEALKERWILLTSSSLIDRQRNYSLKQLVDTIHPTSEELLVDKVRDRINFPESETETERRRCLDC